MAGFSEYASYDGVGLAELIRRREVKPTEVVEAAIDVIERRNPALNAVIHRRYEAARAEARSKPGGPLAGVPILMKDLGATCAGVPYTAGSKVLRDYVPDHDSEHTARLKRAGLIVLGVTNVPELGFNASTEPDLYGTYAQSLERRAHGGWLEWRLGGSSRGRDGADRPRHRRRGIDPRTRRDLRALRPEAHAAAQSLGTGCGRRPLWTCGATCRDAERPRQRCSTRCDRWDRTRRSPRSAHSGAAVPA
jgi:Amidase